MAKPNIDLLGLQQSPPSPKALTDAYRYLAFWFLPAKFPSLSREDHEDVANEALNRMMQRISEIRYATRIRREAQGLALELLRRRRLQPSVSLDALRGQFGNDDGAQEWNEAAIEQWKDVQCQGDPIERLHVAAKTVLPRLPKKYQRIISQYWDFLRANPEGTQSQFGASIGLRPDAANVTMLRIRRKIAEILTSHLPSNA